MKWLVLLLLIAPAVADPATLPVQIASQFAGQAIDVAVNEAVFDGSADEGEELMRALEAYVAGFDNLQEIPRSSEYSQAEVEQLYRQAQQMVAIVGQIPALLTDAESIYAGCSAEGASAGEQTVLSWGEARQIISRQNAFVASAKQLVDEAPELSTDTFQAGLQRLQGWLEARAPTILDCVRQAELELGIIGGPYLFVEVVPLRPYPGGEVLFLASSSFEVQAPAILEANGTLHTWNIPETELPGNRTFTFRAGPLQEDVVVEVVKAPTYLRAYTAPRIVAGPLFVNATLFTPLPTEPTIFVETDGGSFRTENGTRTRLTTLSPGEYNVTIWYPGTVRHEEAWANRTVSVFATKEALLEDERNHFQKPTQGTLVESEDLDPLVIWLSISLALLIMAASMAARRKKLRTIAEADSMDGVPRIVPLLLGAVVGWWKWLRFRNLVNEGTTAREAAEQYAPGAMDTVDRFEERRYGPTEGDVPDENAARWAWTSILRIRRKP